MKGMMLREHLAWIWPKGREKQKKSDPLSEASHPEIAVVKSSARHSPTAGSHRNMSHQWDSVTTLLSPQSLPKKKKRKWPLTQGRMNKSSPHGTKPENFLPQTSALARGCWAHLWFLNLKSEAKCDLLEVWFVGSSRKADSEGKTKAK